MSQQQLVSIVAAIVRDTGRPAKTIAVAARACVCERSARYCLVRMEREGYIQRVGYQRGWLPNPN